VPTRDMMSESGSPFRGDRPETESWAARVFAANAASEAASGSFEGSVWSGDVSTGVEAGTQATVAQEVGSGLLPVALLAGAGAALVGGLVWAGVVITTRYDIGFLAWFVGAATGLAVVRVAGAPVEVRDLRACAEQGPQCLVRGKGTFCRLPEHTRDERLRAQLLEHCQTRVRPLGRACVLCRRPHGGR